ncbi:MAG: hypothetical protein ACRERC_24040 [Candidatus Binatia bacterium]
MDAYHEGRCRECGTRVTTDRDDHMHRRNDHWCGPIETEYPNSASDTPFGDAWMVPKAIS